MMKKVRINSGKAVHMAEVKTNKNGKEVTYVSCGAIKHHLAGMTVVRPAGKNEEVTCKKCLAAMEKEQQVQKKEVPAEEMSLKEYVEKFGSSFSVSKSDMQPSRSRSGQNKKLTTAQKRKYGII